MVASCHMWLFNTWNMVSATKNVILNFILINLNLSSQMQLLAVVFDSLVLMHICICVC